VYFGFPLSISLHRCSITMKNEKTNTNQLYDRVAQQASRLRCVRSICCGALHQKKTWCLNLQRNVRDRDHSFKFLPIHRPHWIRCFRVFFQPLQANAGTVQMSLLLCPWERQLSRDVSADVGCAMKLCRSGTLYKGHPVAVIVPPALPHSFQFIIHYAF
jgi:hypothetical protein